MNNSRTTNAILNVLFGYSNQFISLFLSFVSRTVFIQVLSTEYLGINSLFSDILQMLSLADLGFNTAMVYSFYKPIAERNQNKLIQLVNFYKKIYSYIAVAIMLIGLAILPFIKYIVNLEEDIPLLNVYYLFSLAETVISYLYIYKTALLTAEQKNYIVVRITIMTNIAKTIIQIVSLIVFRNYIVYLSVALCFTVINNFWASSRADKEYPFLRKPAVSLEKEEAQKIFLNVKAVLVYKISSLLLNATDNTFISVLVNTATVGTYSNYLLINNRVTGLLSVAFNSLTAGIGNVIVTENEEKSYSIFQALKYVCFIISGIVISSYLLLINDLILVWLGKEYTFDRITVLAIALNLYFSCVLQPLWSYREATGLYRKTKYVMLFAAILNIILSFVWGRWWGIKGIIFASIVSRILTYIWYEPYLLFRKYFYKSVVKYYFSILGNILLVLLSTTILSVIFRNFIVDAWVALFIKIIGVGSINIAIFVLCYFNTDGFKIVLNKLKFIFGHFNKTY